MSEQAEAFETSLTTELLGRPLRHYPIALTTESVALAWARQENAPEGATVVADQEVAPRQRKGPPWQPFPSLGLYFAVVLRPGLPPEGEDLLWLLASLGAAEGIEAATGASTRVKWPDDVLVGARKIGGVKVEAQLGPGAIASVVLTFRINVNVEPAQLSPEIRDVATSALIETGGPIERAAMLDAVLGALERRYDDDVPELLEAYRGRCETIGREVRAVLLPRGEVRGTATGIDDFGSLLVDVGGKPTHVKIDQLKKLEGPGAVQPESGLVAEQRRAIPRRPGSSAEGTSGLG